MQAQAIPQDVWHAIEHRAAENCREILLTYVKLDARGLDSIEAELMRAVYAVEQEQHIKLPERRPACVQAPTDRNGAVARVFWLSKLWEHDCETCFYVGTVGDRDFYFHHDGLLGPSWIVRGGSEGSDYISYPDAIVDQLPLSVPHVEDILCARKIARRELWS